MPIQKITTRIAKGGASRLDQCEVPGVARAFLRKLIIAGAVYVNGKRCKAAAHALRGGETVDVYVNSDLKKAEPVKKIDAEIFLPLKILYEDESVICFDKPAGLPTQPTVDDARANLYELAKQQLNKREGKPQYLGLHHRLDRDTSGVVLFTKTQSCNAFIADQFKSHSCQKFYAAVLEGVPKKQSGRIESFLDEVGKQGKITRHGSVKSGGKKAITEYTVLKHNAGFALTELKILTGRTHQIRVHMSELGHPVVGDLLYGKPATARELLKKAGRHLLHAQALEITHPITKNRILIESPVPTDFRKWVE